MFQNSILIRNSEIDFRYFSNAILEPYCWSDGLEKIFINNVGNHDIMFRGQNWTVVTECKVNEITVIDKCTYMKNNDDLKYAILDGD